MLTYDPHESPLIAILVIGLGLAFILGTLANRLKISLLVGYLLAGVAVGPFTPPIARPAPVAPVRGPAAPIPRAAPWRYGLVQG